MIRRALCLFVGLFDAVMPAHASGGHHAVEDAAILEPGQCQFETWVEREAGAVRTLIHAGPACRVGPIELGLNVDRVHVKGEGSAVGAGPHIKWARSLSDTLSVGAVLTATWQDTSPRFVGSTLVVPLTWQVSETLAAHVNIGRDFVRGEPDQTRAGVALEWAPSAAWSLVAERFRESSVNYWRAGVRYALHSSVDADLSQARASNGVAPTRWTLGVTWVFER